MNIVVLFKHFDKAICNNKTIIFVKNEIKKYVDIIMNENTN